MHSRDKTILIVLLFYCRTLLQQLVSVLLSMSYGLNSSLITFLCTFLFIMTGEHMHTTKKWYCTSQLYPLSFKERSIHNSVFTYKFNLLHSSIHLKNTFTTNIATMKICLTISIMKRSHHQIDTLHCHEWDKSIKNALYVLWYAKGLKWSQTDL